MSVEKTPQGSHRASVSKAQRKRLKQIRVKKAANGGYTATHHYHPEHGGTPKADSHAFSSKDEANAHLEQTMRGYK